jgi:hypothetical protein
MTTAVIILGIVVACAPAANLPGTELIRALGPACIRRPVVGPAAFDSTGANHAVVLDSVGRQSNWTELAPLAWKPATLADAQLVACIGEEERALIETCQYTGGSPVRRYQADRKVRLMEAVSGDPVATFTVSDYPRACAASEVTSLTSLVGEVTWTMVQERLSPIVDSGRIPPPMSTPFGQITPSPSDRSLGVAADCASRRLAVDLHGCDLHDAYDLAHLDLTGANLQGTNLQGVDLHDDNLTGANLQGADLQGADLHEDNLTGANLQGANLQGANLWDADLTNANLTGADLGEVVWLATTCPDGTSSDDHDDTCIGYGIDL